MLPAMLVRLLSQNSGERVQQKLFWLVRQRFMRSHLSIGCTFAVGCRAKPRKSGVCKIFLRYFSTAATRICSGGQFPTRAINSSPA
jgi:hypothetical protein